MNQAKAADSFPEFSLLGGPLYLLGSRLGLIRNSTNTIPLGLALGLLAWGVLMLLACLQGFGHKVLSLAFVGVHVRFLVAVPLFFACESWVVPWMAEFVRNIVGSGLVPKAGLPALEAIVRRVGRLKYTWLAEAVLLLAAIALSLIEPMIGLPGKTGSWTLLQGQSGAGLSWGHGWYLGFCLPLFRFLLLRWIWHLALWWYFLWRLNRINLQLMPAHSDGAAGLGYLEVVHEHFIPLVFALSAILSASFAEDIFLGAMEFEALYRLAPMVLILTALLFLGPLFAFSRRLWICRSIGLSEYMIMAYRYVHAFDRRWIRSDGVSGESQLGTGDVQSLADLTNSVNVIRNMRLAPMSWRLARELMLAALLPLLPLLLLKYPAVELTEKLFQALTGL